jgi:hypothetical protein
MDRRGKISSQKVGRSDAQLPLNTIILPLVDLVGIYGLYLQLLGHKGSLYFPLKMCYNNLTVIKFCSSK